MISGQDKKYVKRCFQLAMKGLGKVSPNPLVGAVIVIGERVISEGWHAEFGKDHAEAMAIKKAKVNLKGATLYCNLEPCIHTKKKTPPCYPLIVQSGIKRVVISNLDPNPFVAGKSVQQMEEQGITVDVGILEEEGSELNRFFFKHIKKGKPWITLKMAQSIDGKISKKANEQTWLTGTQSRKYVHKLRAEYDAVLVGSNTVNVDDPQLNVREVKGRNPLKIIISAGLKLKRNSYILNHAEHEPVWIFCDEKLIQSAGKNYNKYAKFIGCPLNENGKIDLEYVMDILYKEKIGSVLIEGGQKVFSGFLQLDLYDELIVLQAPVIIGDGLTSVNLNTSKNFRLNYVKRLGNDICFNLRKKETNQE
jgi:diaminohydroxyphosphoribosylaminopyrimidine deaminase / 5-amino-6-(5-phosphoribosylamino)uracil reductase